MAELDTRDFSVAAPARRRLQAQVADHLVHTCLHAIDSLFAQGGAMGVKNSKSGKIKAVAKSAASRTTAAKTALVKTAARQTPACAMDA